MGRPFLPRPLCRQCGSPCKDLDRIFCSNKCRAEHDKGKSKPYMLGNQYSFRGDDATTWAHYKRMQRLCPPSPCSDCGATENIVIHHKDHNPRNTVPDNLIRLCRACHINHHRDELREAYDIDKGLKKRV
jgi:hypothetical protein